MWDMMSRGSFNGPGGQHARYLIPPTQGEALGSQHNVRNKRVLNFLTDNDLLRLNRDGLRSRAWPSRTSPRVRPPRPAARSRACNIALDGAGDNEPPCYINGVPTRTATASRAPAARRSTASATTTRWRSCSRSARTPSTPGHGVLISKTKNANSSCGTSSCFVWVIDSHPEDINKVDFVAADGTPKKATIGDERQKNDGSFNAGLARAPRTSTRTRPTACTSTSSTRARTPRASCTTPSACARSTAPARRRAASRSPSPQLGAAEGFTTCTFNLKNTGAAAAVPAGTHPQDASAYLNNDIYRLSATATGTGWSAYLKNAFATAKFGDTVSVPVYIEKGTGAGTVTLNAVSESRSDQDRLRGLHAGRRGASAARCRRTLALTMGAPASFGPLHARVSARTTSPRPRPTSSPPRVTRR